MTVQFTYPDLWAFYHQASRESQISILRQVERILDSVSSKVRTEILKDAPDDVVRKYNTQAVKTVGQLEKELRRILR